jgi:hypothetical protein
VEVFFARQAPNTGIASHTDGANFIQTSHVGLDVPEGQCWMKVGEHTRHWKNGEAFVCDTSFMHETWNGGDTDRFVLIMRHWHPELSLLERVALQFVFDSLDDPTPAGIKEAQKVATRRVKEVGAGATRRKSTAGGGGFGKK